MSYGTSTNSVRRMAPPVAASAAAANDGKNPKQNKKEHRCRCGKVFNLGKNLYAHIRSVHGEEPLRYKCSACNKKYKTKDALLSHTSKYQTSDHTYVNTRQNRTVLMCPAEGCSHQFTKHSTLVQHLNKQHDLLIEIEGFMFQSMSDFHKWKTDMEQATSSSYVRCSRTKELQDGTRTKYYACHRSFSFINKTEDRKLKDMGMCEMNAACPSLLEVSVKMIEDIETVTVKFWKPHYGHADLQKKRALEKENEDSEMKVLQIIPMTSDEDGNIVNVITKHNYVTKLLSRTLTVDDDEAEILETQYDAIINILSSKIKK